MQTTSGTVALRADAILLVTRRSALAQMEVLQGTVWLTESPSNGDVLLRAGDRFDFQDRFLDRIDAKKASLHPGFWRLEDVRIAVGDQRWNSQEKNNSMCGSPPLNV